MAQLEFNEVHFKNEGSIGEEPHEQTIGPMFLVAGNEYVLKTEWVTLDDARVFASDHGVKLKEVE